MKPTNTTNICLATNQHKDYNKTSFFNKLKKTLISGKTITHQRYEGGTLVNVEKQIQYAGVLCALDAAFYVNSLN